MPGVISLASGLSTMKDLGLKARPIENVGDF